MMPLLLLHAASHSESWALHVVQPFGVQCGTAKGACGAQKNVDTQIISPLHFEIHPQQQIVCGHSISM